MTGLSLFAQRSLRILLLAAVGSGAIASCSVSPALETTPSAQNTSTESTQRPAAAGKSEPPSGPVQEVTPSVSESGDGTEPTDLMGLYTQGLEAGMLYGEVRAKLLAQGWIPHTPITHGIEADHNDPSIRQMAGLGFSEVKACSGTGLGLCKFEFVFEPDRAAENGAVLSVSATRGNQSETGEPALWSWGMQNSVNTTYADRPFDIDISRQLQENGLCPNGSCSHVKYAFEDVLLWASVGYGFGGTKISIFPRATGKSLSTDEALAYARSLDIANVIDFDDRRTSEYDNNETYYEFGTPQENISEGRHSVTFVTLHYRDDGRISEISFEDFVF